MFELYVTLQGHDRIDFNSKPIRKTLREQANPIRDAAKRAVSGRQLSMPRMNPGMQTGLLKKSIKAKVSKSGFSVAIAPFRIGRMKQSKDGFYPAYLLYGTRDGKLRPRNNYMKDAFNSRREIARQAILNTLMDSLKPRAVRR